MASSQYSLYNVHVNELFEFCLIYEKISGTTNYSYSIETLVPPKKEHKTNLVAKSKKL